MSGHSNIEAERAIIAGLFVDPHVIPTVAIQLKPEMFYRVGNQRVFEAMLNIYGVGGNVTFLSVIDWLERADKMTDLPSREDMVFNLRQMCEGLPSSYGIEKWSDIVFDCYARRELAWVGRQLNDLSKDKTVAREGLLEHAESKIAEMRRRTQSGSIGKISQYTDQIIIEHAERKVIRESGANILPGISSGIPDLDLFTAGWRPGQFIVVGARPKVGKTSFLLEICRLMAMNELDKRDKDIKGVLLFSLEMSIHELAQKLVCREAGVDSQKALLGKLDDADEAKLETAGEAIDELPLYVDATSGGLNIGQIRGKCHMAVDKYNIGVIVLDYLQFVKKSYRQQSDYEKVTEASRACKMIAKELGVPFITAVQLKREVAQRSAKTPPTMADIRNSGDVEQDADQIILMHRKSKPHVVEADIDLIIDANRAGPTGTIGMCFQRNTGAFSVPVDTPDTENWNEKEGTNEQQDQDWLERQADKQKRQTEKLF